MIILVLKSIIKIKVFLMEVEPKYFIKVSDIEIFYNSRQENLKI